MIGFEFTVAHFVKFCNSRTISKLQSILFNFAALSEFEIYMLDKLEAIKARFEQLGVALTNPEIVNDNKKFAATSKEYRSLERIVNAHSEYKKILDDIDFYKEALNGDDEELRELAKEEAPQLEERKEKLESYIRQLLLPKDPQDEKNAILEIRAGTGGDEASLFAGDLLRMYLRYCEKKGWKTT